jgi:polyisoprenoid-binding protein YceI
MHSEVQNPHSGDINVSATITINGNCQTMNFPIQWVRISGTDIRFVGSQNINMTDFDIKPPSPAFGLVKVNDLITINFHLIVQTNTSVFADGVNLGQP